MPADAVIAGITAALQVGAVSADVVAVEARLHANTADADTDRDAAATSAEPLRAQRVISLPQRRLADPAAVIAGLPPDRRPLPSVDAYDQLLPTRKASQEGAS